MGILIADSGSTKTEWLYTGTYGESNIILSCGLNPYFTSEEVFCATIANTVEPIIKSDNNLEIFFYGSGCGNQENRDLIRYYFTKILHIKNISIETDLTGAGRALFGNGEGLACILGTGANAGIYINGEIVESSNSAGYILGDEGSGAYIGKILLSAFLKNELPQQIKNLLLSKYDISREVILENVYKKPFPNRYLAGFSVFMAENINDEWVKDELSKSFSLFFKYFIQPLTIRKKYHLGFCGTIATVFGEILNQISVDSGFDIPEKINSITRKLSDYHLNKI